MNVWNGNSETQGRRPDADAVLVNIIWIVEHLDETGIRALANVPVLELAKHISIGRRAA